MRIAIVTTVDTSLHVMFPGLFPRLIGRGWRVTGISADGPMLNRVLEQGIDIRIVPMNRDFSPRQDLACLLALVNVFRRERFDLIHYNTPKAALLASLAGRLAGCVRLLYTCRGLGYWSYGGWRRRLGWFAEWIACRLAHRVIAISPSLREEMVHAGLALRRRVTVLGSGSSRGVDLEAFAPEADGRDRGKLRTSLGIGESDLVIGYAGRMALEKGIEVLLETFTSLCAEYPHLHLVLIGHVDQRVPLSEETWRELRRHPQVHVLSFTDNLASVLRGMDIFVLLSEREGFGNALIEASAVELPVIGSDIPGCRDAVVPGVTGLLVRPDDRRGLTLAVRRLITQPVDRRRMGEAGRRWVREHFDRKDVWSRLIAVYESMLTGQPRGAGWQR